MSPQITNVVLPHTGSGKLKCCMVHTLRALRNSPRVLLNTMDVFVKEPSLDWKVSVRISFFLLVPRNYILEFVIDCTVLQSNARKQAKAQKLSEATRKRHNIQSHVSCW